MKAVLLVNGTETSPMGMRARSLAAHAGDGLEFYFIYRNQGKVSSALRMWRRLSHIRPDVVYVFDPGYSGVAAALAFRLQTGTPVVIETGDAIYTLAKSSGMRGPIGLAATWLLEYLALHGVDQVVVRGSKHVEHLAAQQISALQIPDGIDIQEFRSLDASALRRRIGLQDSFVVGMVGTMIWSERLRTCYGREIIEALRDIPDSRVKALLVGGGDGLEKLKQLTHTYGLRDRVIFTGRIPLASLALYVNAMDVCVSTQSNNLAGQVRTTGKLPLYMGCGKYVLATDVGEASIVLPQEMRLPYSGEYDPDYPDRLAQRIVALQKTSGWREKGYRNRVIAAERFDYARLGLSFAEILRSTAIRAQMPRLAENAKEAA
jgi:glycosyltransferase involved in cell wall biosynthesis